MVCLSAATQKQQYLQMQLLCRPHGLIHGVQRCMEDKLMQVLRLLLHVKGTEDTQAQKMVRMIHWASLLAHTSLGPVKSTS